jgi:hypothetical protein
VSEAGVTRIVVRLACVRKRLAELPLASPTRSYGETNHFSLEEIKDTIDHMEKNKAPGPNGFPIEFFQSC